MAEIFSEGVNPVWYRAANFATGKNITVRFRKPDSTLVGPYTVPESEDAGIYRLDYNFDGLGQWVGVFFENGLKTSSSVFHIVPKTSPIVPYNGETMKCQTCKYFKMVRGKDYGICELATTGNPYRFPNDTCPSYSDMST